MVVCHALKPVAAARINRHILYWRVVDIVVRQQLTTVTLVFRSNDRWCAIMSCRWVDSACHWQPGPVHVTDQRPGAVAVKSVHAPAGIAGGDPVLILISVAFAPITRVSIKSRHTIQ